jgi:hypothetical protein
MSVTTRAQTPWPSWKKVVFRFLFVYFLLWMSPWTWLDTVPGVGYITAFYYRLMDWAVNAANDYVFHVKKVLVPPNGSGDTVLRMGAALAFYVARFCWLRCVDFNR